MNVRIKVLVSTIFLCLFAILSGPAAGQPTTRPGDLVGYWQMGEGASESGGAWTVPDDSANNNAATGGLGGISTVTGAIGVGGAAGTALSFDGNIGSALGVDGTTTLANIGAGSFSVSLWMKADQANLIAGGDWHRVVTKEESGGNRWTVENEYNYGGSNKLAWFTTGAGYPYTDLAEFDANEWRHLVFVRDTATEQLLAYDNGVNISTHGGPGAGVSVANTADFGIAGKPDGEAPLHAIMDDVRIYNVALTSGDVAAIYNGGAGDLAGAPINLPFEWKTSELGNWNTSANWTLGVPNGDRDTVVFGNMVSAPTLVNVQTPVTVNRMEFDNTSNNYILAGAGSVNLAASTAPLDPTVSVVGTHEFQARVNLMADTTMDITSGSTVTFNNALDLAGHTLTKTGAGAMSIRNDLMLGGGTLDIQQGTIAGNGTISGDVTNDGGTVSPGNSLESSASSVPEPNSLLLIAVGWLAITCRRKIS